MKWLLYENMIDIPLEYIGLSVVGDKFYMVHAGDVGIYYVEITEKFYQELLDSSNYTGKQHWE